MTIDSVTGGLIMNGRSDGTLNPGGVRYIEFICYCTLLCICYDLWFAVKLLCVCYDTLLCICYGILELSDFVSLVLIAL